ncbi:MAG: serine/threonine-protein kinase [Chthoniobacterales bacterium]
MSLQQESGGARAAQTQLSNPDVAVDIDQVRDVRLRSLLSNSSAESDIWLGESTDGERVAVKIYRHGQLPGVMDLQKKQALRHPHLVPIIDAGEVQGRYYEISPFQEGPTLDRFIVQHGVLAGPEATELLQQLSDAIHYLHEQQILHRDIKPSNIFISNRQPLEVALADFGSARLTAYQTMLTGTIGTVAYSAPEAVTGLQSEASDYWSLAMVLLEAMTGRQAFQGLDLKQQLYRVASGQVEVPEALPERWQTLFRGLLTTDYTRRWRKKEIDAWLNSGSSSRPVIIPKAPVSSVRERVSGRVELERLPEPGELSNEALLELLVGGALRPLFRYFWVAFVVGGMTRSSVLAALILVLLVAVGVALEFRPAGMERYKRESRVERQLRSLPRKKRRKIRRIVREWMRETGRANS